MEKTLAYKPQSAWETYADAKQRKSMEALAARYIDFLTRCKTERETVDYVRERLSQAGYSEDFSKERVLRPLRGKALFAARRGSEPLEEGLALIAAHADTPRLDFKQRPLIEQPGVAQAKTHYYGGIRKYQWLAALGPARGGHTRKRRKPCGEHRRKAGRAGVLHRGPAAASGPETEQPDHQRGI